MKKKKGIIKSKKKLTGFIVASLLVLVTAFGFLMPNNFKSILNNVRNVFAAGEVPAHQKTRDVNKINGQNDGTYKIGLTVKGDAEKKPQKVNVIVIVDRSGSMDTQSGTGAYVASNQNGTNMYGLIDGEYVQLTRHGNGNYWSPYYYTDPSGNRYEGQRYFHDNNATRMEATQEAVNGLANTLLGYNGKDGNPDDTVEMALVSFATTSSTNVANTTSATTFVNAVNGLDANGGTNWESALQRANNISFGDNDPTYVIFFSDGSPTFRTTQAGHNDRYQTGVYGSGHEEEPNMSWAYNEAKDDAASLATKFGTDKFYTIFAYGSNAGKDYMTDLTTEAGAPAGNNYSASNTAALQEAFAEILEKIEMSGIANAVINDGTTNQVETSTGIVELLEVDESSYTYYKIDKDGNETEWTDPKNDDEIAAHLVNGAVVWDLSKLGVLENDVTYKVTFDVYPSQTTYDYIAELENGTRTYESLPSEVRQYLKRDTSLGTTSYTLETNTEATLKFTDTRTGVTRTVDYNELDGVPTSSDTISISKEWDNSIDTRKERPVSVRILKTDDEGDFQNFCFTSTCTAELNESNSWSLSDIHIATGLARLEGNKLTVLDTGHDYKFDELGSEAYNWELETETVHPMLINGVPTKLILVEKDAPDMGSDSFKTIDGKDYYKLDNGKVYVKSTDGNNIKAENHRRSNLNIKKNVTGENANPNDKFEFTIKVTQKDKNGDKIADDTTTTNDDLWFSICDTSIDATCKSSDSLVMDDSLVTGAQKEIKEGAWTGYYYTPNDSEVKVNLKDKYNLRFTNLVSNTDFSVVESNMTNYELAEITATGFSSSEGGKDGYSTTGSTITGNIGESNTVYQVEYTNKNTKPENVKVKVTKIWDDGNDSAGFRPDVLTITIKDGNGNTVDTQTVPVRTTEDGKWYYESKDLPKYKDGKEVTYEVEETFDNQGNKYTLGTPEEKATNEFEITNSYEPENVKVKVTKIWDDGNDSAGFRPDELTITIKDGDGNTVDTQTVPVRTTEDGKWYYESKELPKYKDGEEVIYSVEEAFDDPKEKYTLGTPEEKATNEFEITNSYTPETVKVEGTKTWKDNDNAYSTRPGSIEIILWKNNGKTRVNSQTVTPDDNGNWSYSFTELPKYENGTEIGYSVTETPVSQYTTNQDGNNFINLLTGKVSVKGVKKWIDGNNQDNSRPEALLLVLIKNGQKTNQTYSVSESDNWSHTWDNLDEYDEDGVKIEYSVDEDSVPEGYEKGEVTYSKEEKAYVITNTHEIEKTSIKVTKEWIDANNKFGKRPSSIKVTLKANGTAKETVEVGLDEDGNPLEGTTVINDNSWSYTWSGLDKNAGGSEINYTVSEAEVSGYATSDPEKTDEGWIIYNTLKDQTKDIKVTKVWEDDSNRDNLRPENGLEVTITGRVGDEVVVGPKPITLTNNGTNTWTGTFEQLPVFKDGKLVSYIVDEDLPEGYEQIDYTGSEDTGFTITNEHIPTEIKISGTKKWEDHNDVDGLQPTEITLTLIGNEKELKTITVEVGEDGTWSFNFDDLKLYKNENGQPIKYEIKEKTVDGYETIITDVTTDESITYTVLNTHTPKISYKVTKSWDDLGNNDGIRPDSITVRLLANGNEFDSQVISEENGWTYTFVDLDRFDSDGNLIKYTIIEDEVEGYETTIDAGEITETTQEVSATVTNKHEAELHEDITVTKTWVDDNNKYGVRPEEITIRLLANDKEVKVAKLTAANGWTFTFSGLLRYKDGVEIIYTITEDAVLNYDSEIDGFKVTNTYNGPHGEIVPPNTMVSANGVNKDNFSVLFFLILGLIGLMFRKEANN